MKTLAREADAAELLERVRRLRHDAARRWGRMSPHQMVCHVNDAFRMALGERETKDIATRASRTFIRWLALYGPLSWPTGIMTTPELDQDYAGTCPKDFSADLDDLGKLLRSTAAKKGRGPWPVHPIFGPMSERDWLRWAYLHTDHHLRQFGV